MNRVYRGNGDVRTPADTTSSEISRIAHRLVTLTDLQVELLKTDLKDGFIAVMRPAVMLAMGAMCILSSVTLVLASVAYAFHDWAGCSPATACLLASLLGLAMAAGAILQGRRLMRGGLAAFDRSRQELRANVAWLRETLRRGSTQ